MFYNPIKFTTAATSRRLQSASMEEPTMVNKQLFAQDKPLYYVDARELVLKPMSIAFLAIREAERLRYICFDGTGRYRKASGKIAAAIRDLRKHLTQSFVHAEDNLASFLEYRFYEDTKNILSKLRLNVDQYIKSLNPDAADINILAQSEVTRFLARIAVELLYEYVKLIVAHGIESRMFIDRPGIDALVAMQKACVDVEEIASAHQTKSPSKAREAALDATLKATIRALEETKIAQSDKFTCCGVCKYYTYEVASKGSCKFPLNKASQMRPACKRFKRINENLDK